MKTKYHLLIGIRRRGKVEGIALVRGQCDAGNVWAQVEQERVQAGAQSDGGEDAQAHPVRDEPQVLPNHLNVWLVGARSVASGGNKGYKSQEQAQQDLVLQQPGIIIIRGGEIF